MVTIIGPHVNRNKVVNSTQRPSIVEHINKAIEVANTFSINVGVISIFVGNPRSRIITLTNEEQIELKKYIKKTGLQIIAHSSYAATPWNGNPAAIEHIKEEIKVCINASIEGLVLHLPKKDPSIVIKYLKKIDNLLVKLNSPKFIIYLETPAFVPPKKINDIPLFYSTPDNLFNLFDLINKELKYKNYSLCIDTAHLWVAGEDIQLYNEAKKWFTEIERIFKFNLSIHKNLLIHLNDSAKEQGTGPDKHASLMMGKIWKNHKFKDTGLCFILEFAKKWKIPLILERPNIYMLNDDYKYLSKHIL